MDASRVRIDLRNHLLFDGNCGFCNESARFFRRVDTKNLFHLIPYQDVPESDLQPLGLDHKKCDEAVRLVTPKGRVLSGPFALNYIFFNYFPWSVMVVIIYVIPVFLLCEMIVYSIIASNRHRISKWLGLEVCRLN